MCSLVVKNDKLKRQKTMKKGLVSLLRVGVCFASVFSISVAHAADAAKGVSASKGHAVIRYGDYQKGGAHIVRIGVGKSIVVDLPRDVKDVMVATPNVANAVIRTPRRAYIFGQQFGGTSIFFFDEMGKQIAVLDVQVERDVASLGEAINRLMPGSDIKVESLGQTVVLSGSVLNSNDAKAAVDMAARFAQGETNVINKLEVTAEDQVHLKVLVAELSRDLVKQLGIDLGAAGTFGKVVLEGAISNGFSYGAPSNILSGLVNGGGQRTFGFDIRSLENTGVIRTLAEPTLTAVSGEKASFNAGGEFAIPVAAGDGNISTEYKNYGVSLDFVPYVVDETRISLKIDTEVSEISTSGSTTFSSGGATINVPGIQTRRASTTVELPAGGSLVMAGILQETVRQQINGTPGLKNIPILGALFRSREYQTSQTELAIIVTPYIVRPTSAKNLARPTDGYETPDDISSFLLGNVNKKVSAPSSTGSTNNKNWGFIIK